MPSTEPQRRESAVLLANASFYRAFSNADYAGMSALWAEHAPVTCLHPGATMLVGRRAVMEGWRAVLSSPLPVTVRGDRPRAQIYGEFAIVLCYEGNSNHPAHLAATNVFVLEGGSWRLVHHQAGPLSDPIVRPSPRNDSN